MVLAGASLLQFSLIGWQTARFENARVRRLIERELATFVHQPSRDLAGNIDRQFGETLRTLPVSGLFDRAGARIGGDVARYPAALPPDGRARHVLVRLGDGRSLAITAASATLPDGDRLLIGRDLGELAELRQIMRRALLFSFLPGLALSLAGGAWLGHRALIRVGDLHRAIERIVVGPLHERLPSGGTGDDLDRLVGSVNRMLDRIERLVSEVRGVGDDIAHDLRTPLARARAALERTRHHAIRPDDLKAGIDRAIADLDRTFTIITALLRIAEIEHRDRRAGFARADLAAIAIDALELYEPIAEAKSIALSLRIEHPAAIDGDRDLLMEALANLLDNAIKFTEPGGRVETVVCATSVCVSDDGIGLSDADRHSVLKRFYRVDRSRHLPGSGLGLSLVAAIADLHGAAIRVEPQARGARFVLEFRPISPPGDRANSLPAGSG